MGPMGGLLYGPQGKEVEIEIRTLNYIGRERVPSPDGSERMLTKWTIDINGVVVNPGALSYAPGPTKRSGLAPTETDWNIRKILNSDRQHLVYKIGEDILIESPIKPATVDSAGGPFVKKCNIVETTGIRLQMFHFIVETYIHDCEWIRSGAASGGERLADQGKGATIRLVPTMGSINPVLSHRWTRYEDTDHDYFPTITTEGVAVFDMAVLSTLGTIPDSYRQDLLHLAPPDFKRQSISVYPDSDGSSLYYRIVDRQMPFNLESNLGLTRIECYHTEGTSTVSAGEAAVRGAGGVIGGVLGLDFGRVAGAIGGAILDTVPKTFSSCICRGWGNRISVMASGLYTALGIILHRMPWIMTSSLSECIAVVDPFGRWCEVTVTVKSGLADRLGALIGGLGAAAAAMPGLFMPLIDLTRPAERILFSFVPLAAAGVIYVDGAWSAADPSFSLSREIIDMVDPTGLYTLNAPNSKGTRGTWLALLVGQILSGAICARPPVPRPKPVSAGPVGGLDPGGIERGDKALPTWPSS